MNFFFVFNYLNYKIVKYFVKCEWWYKICYFKLSGFVFIFECEYG